MSDEEYRPLSLYEVHVWALQMHVMLAAGLPLMAALELVSLGEIPHLAATCDELADGINGGRRLSEVMQLMSPTFSPFVVNLVAVGERSGRLAQVFDRISVRAFQRDKTSRSVRAALAYPAFLAVISLAMAFFMAFYMFPKLLPFLLGLKVALPWPTRALIWGADHLPAFLLVFSVVGVWGGHVLFTHSAPVIVRARDWLLFESPVVGKINSERVYSDTLNDLHMLLEAQADLLGSMRALNPPWMAQRARILEAVEAIRGGSTFTQATGSSGMFPERFLAAIGSSEESGQLPNTFRMLSVQLEESVSLDLERLVQLLEPTIMAGMGITVGFIVVATFLPLYSLSL